MKKHVKKSFKLINKQDISLIYKQGEVFHDYPFRLIWTNRKENETLKFLISVPKKNFKRAVDRNLIKRQIKEVLNNKIINSYLQEKYINLVITYIGDQKIDFKELDSKMIITFRKFILKHYSDEKKTS